jgi:hypothetical protein
MFDLSAQEIGNRFEEVADAETVMTLGQAATVISLLKAILLQLTILAKAATEEE